MNAQAKSSLTFGQKLFTGLQYFLPHIALTRAIGWLMEREQPWLKNLMIKNFVRMFNVNTDELDKKVPQEFTSLNAFFTRTLPDTARPIDPAQHAIASPVDGVVSACGLIEQGRLIQAKGFTYSAAELLDDATVAQQFDGGIFATIYLAPFNYHRVHTAISGTVNGHQHVPGKLFSVNGATANAVPRLFSRNERRVFMIDHDGTATALVMVGALNVGSISTVWDGFVAAGSHDHATPLPLPESTFAKGDTLGWFNMGSTVILLFPKNSAHWHDEFLPGTAVRVGEAIGTLNPHA